MPKVIKHGKKEFIGNCSLCGCEFYYTLEELQAQYPLKFVHCPECGDEYYHPNQDAPQDLAITDNTGYYYDWKDPSSATGAASDAIYWR